MAQEPDEAQGRLFCTWHPKRETLLRCQRCDRPMCVECAVRHPVGLRCPECTRALRPPHYRVTALGYARSVVVALVLGTVAAVPAALAARLLWILGLLIAAPLAAVVAEGVWMASGRKRGQGLALIAAGGLIGGLVVASLLLSRSLSLSGALFLGREPGIWIYLVLGVSTVLARLR